MATMVDTAREAPPRGVSRTTIRASKLGSSCREGTKRIGPSASVGVCQFDPPALGSRTHPHGRTPPFADTRLAAPWRVSTCTRLDRARFGWVLDVRAHPSQPSSASCSPVSCCSPACRCPTASSGASKMRRPGRTVDSPITSRNSARSSSVQKTVMLNPGILETGNPPIARPRKPAPSSSTIVEAHMDGAERERKVACPPPGVPFAATSSEVRRPRLRRRGEACPRPARWSVQARER